MKISIEIPAQAQRVARRYTDPDTGQHLTLKRVLRTLAADLVLAETRPRSWEGYTMRQLLHAHGWTEDGES